MCNLYLFGGLCKNNTIFFTAGEHLILSLDCSSTLALVQLEVLHQIEEVTHKKIPDLFEWIVASGVGGFLMMVMIYSKGIRLT